MLQIYESKIDKIIQNGVKSTKRALKPYFWQSSKTIHMNIKQMHFHIHISQTLRFFSFYCISNHNNVFAKYLDKVLTDFP